MAIKTLREYYNYSGAEPREAEILEVRQQAAKDMLAVLLDKTIFYPEGGGQGGDRGTINGLPVLDTIEENGEILHLVSVDNEKPLLKPGKATLLLDCRRRRDFTVIHTGQHLLSGILYRNFGIPTISAHLGEDHCFIDIDCLELKEEKILEAEEMVMDAIEANIPVITHLCPPENPESFPLRKQPPKEEETIRIVEIEGVDFSPCCGTHLKSTGEIGMLRVLEAEKYKGRTRLSLTAGRRCLYESRLLRKNATQVSRVLSVPITETGQGVLDFVEKARENEHQLKSLKEESCLMKAEALVKKDAFSKIVSGRTYAFITELYKADISDLINIGKKAQKLTQAVLILVSETENKFAAFCGQKDIDIRPFFLEKQEEYGIRGGGGPSFFQGSFSSGKDIPVFIKDFTPDGSVT
jgi:alanyl-tRNA synthetase